jgi:hypothetical protein
VVNTDEDHINPMNPLEKNISVVRRETQKEIRLEDDGGYLAIVSNNTLSFDSDGRENEC